VQRVPARSEADAEVARLFDHVRATRGHVSTIMKCLGHAPEGLERFAAFGEYARYRESIPFRTRELLILCLARDNLYAFMHHVKPALKAGLTIEQIRTVLQGATPSGLEPAEAAVAAFATEFAQGGKVSDAVFAQLEAYWQRQHIVELHLIAAYYLALGSIIASFRMELEPEYVALRERLA
jgi:alkylhydroperoxidase family enzyme